jgi:hypothetical protein
MNDYDIHGNSTREELGIRTVELNINDLIGK